MMITVIHSRQVRLNGPTCFLTVASAGYVKAFTLRGHGRFVNFSQLHHEYHGNLTWNGQDDGQE